MNTLYLVAATVLAAGAGAGADAGDPLQTLRPHPRLIATEQRIQTLRVLVRENPDARALYLRLVEEAKRIEAQPSVVYKVENNRLTDAGLLQHRVYTLALLYRLDGHRRYLDRAVQELRAAAAFPDWRHTGHFLDTLYLMQGVAIGFDWLYDSLAERDRVTIRRALVEKGLDPALARYPEPRGWHRRRFNLNQAFNGGVGLAALAIAEAEPEKCRQALQLARESIALALPTYGPDGGWPEGPGYWTFGSRFAVSLLAALETALGTDFGLSDTPGFSLAGRFRVYTRSPTGKAFNFSDGAENVGSAAQLYWMARRFQEPVYAWLERSLEDVTRDANPLSLVWFEPRTVSPKQAHWPLNAIFRGAEVAVLRTSWDDPDAIFAGIKGGDSAATHSHPDLGTFVLDAGGHRWAMDLGADSYSLPAYHGSKRSTYYRTRTEAHNVILIDNENQEQRAKAPIVFHAFTPQRAEVRLDLTQAYGAKLRRLERTMAVLEGRAVAITDVLESDEPREAVWGMVTDAAVTLCGKHAELRKPGWILAARIHSPPQASFEVVSTAAPPPQATNAGTRKLVVRLPGKVRRLRLVVSLLPYRESEVKPRLPEEIASH